MLSTVRSAELVSSRVNDEVQVHFAGIVYNQQLCLLPEAADLGRFAGNAFVANLWTEFSAHNR
jgi:hypothetical protein